LRVSFNKGLDDSLDVLKLLDEDEEELVDCNLLCGVMNLFKLETLPLMMPPSELMNRSCWSAMWP
jgi:hypothetical protein